MIWMRSMYVLFVISGAILGNLLDGPKVAQVAFRSYNYPDRYIRHMNMEVWISSDGGPNA